MQQGTLNIFTKKSQNQQAMQIEETSAKQSFLPWVEKYRPNSIEDISYQDEVIGGLRGVLKTGSMPHLLFYGPPGTGKTSAILALAKQLFGPDFWRKRVLELNASDDRGIAVVRKKIKNFAEQIAAKNPNQNYLCPAYKIVILDEADSITREAQDALRRIIEDFQSTRFCIICNYITKISEPLASRCVKYRFKGIPQEQQVSRLQYIANQEGVEINQYKDIQINREALNKLYDISGGDLRRSINLLQSTSILADRYIKKEMLYEVSGFIQEYFIEDMLTAIKTRQVFQVLDFQKYIMREGFNIEQLLSQFSEILMKDDDIHELRKAKILELVANCERQLKEGSSPDIALLNFMAQSQKVLI